MRPIPTSTAVTSATTAEAATGKVEPAETTLDTAEPVTTSEDAAPSATAKAM